MIAIYTRVSTDTQAETGTSLETQTAACRSKAKELGYDAELAEVYRDEGESGADIDRPALNSLRRDIERGIITEAVFIYDPDRLSRKLHYQLILEEEFKIFNVKLIFVNSDNRRDTSEGRLLWHMQGAVAEYERDKIRERTVRGKLEKARQGQILPMRFAPYGYKLENGTLIVNEGEAELVRNIYRWYVAGLTMRQIGRRLIEAGAQTRYGDWNASTIRNILSNDTYIGNYRYNKHKHEKIPNRKTAGGNSAIKEKRRPESDHIIIQVPAIVDDVIWHSAQVQKQKNTKNAMRNSQLQYLGRGGYLHCADCGRVLQNTCYTSGNGDNAYRVGVYRCPDINPRSYGKEKCSSSSIKASFLDLFIWQDLTEALLAPENIRYLDQEEPKAEIDFDAEKKRLTKSKDALTKEKDKILRLYRKEEISMEDVERQLADIKRHENILASQWQLLVQHEQETQRVRMTEQEREALFSAIRPFVENPSALSFEDRRYVFEQLVTSISVRLRPGHVVLRYDGVFQMETEHLYEPNARPKPIGRNAINEMKG